ncbi:hypothetical protein METBIDRAFT_78823 [Metschnikowia bicuspidata var. bicuspidata NRRL YB-4993]|uniref:Uncharacterized protein n=1 Tax=Metschnikowia bicuspidata var. bicuspidata NRRL YB-4993 TaxID=869754 RepID=A0A1A0H991_9ASCO|nr:hypothetical protein METBIDRAFT_78823 [Metschnikowia bicuspidata var. bicuspidata NRRL YB-4993]OBA20443.1 hypothetical protein METBIDRAFT_78823 [Metschnikowia bicuspidata var. bicuspidata NRRL YB-4993]
MRLIFNKYKSTKTDSLSLAGALGLLAPHKDITKSTTYKPSLFRNLQKGSVSEEYAEFKHQQPISFEGPSAVHQKLIANLMSDLRHATEFVSWPKKLPAIKNLNVHVKSLTNEAELLDLLRSSYIEKQLSLPLLMRFLLNKHLKDLTKLPFDVANINRSEFTKHGWSNINFVELKILLLKKYHDLQQPLEIVKQLKLSFGTEFLPLIRKHQLLPFYERIVWKFFFEYIGMGEEKAIIEELNSLKSSFLVWEATTARNGEILTKILHQHQLNTPQMLFVKVASCDLVQRSIEAQLAHGRSALLSALKQTSWKFKVYKSMDTNEVMARAYVFSLIHNLEDILTTHFPDSAGFPELQKILMDLKAERERMIKPEAMELDYECEVLYAH